MRKHLATVLAASFAAVHGAASPAGARSGADILLQGETATAAASLSLGGLARVKVFAASPVSLAGLDPADLNLEMDIRVTRHDGATGGDSLKYVRNGLVFLRDSSGAEVFRGDSPVQTAVPEAFRRAGEWMPAAYSLKALKPGAGEIASVEVWEYNDSAKEGVRTGISYEVRNIRLTRKDRLLESMVAAVESKRPVTFCNPLDLEYMIQRGKRQPDGRTTDVYCESADPALVPFKGEYWLFASHGEGYWHSKDMGRWRFVPVDVTKPVLSEFRRYAPATCVIGEWLYLTHSEGGRILRTKNPADASSWEDVGWPQGWADPGMIYDDPATGGDGYVYIYKGLSHRDPIRVARLDPKNGMKIAGVSDMDCAWPDQLNRGFEVPGDFGDNYGGKDTQEGAWPVRFNGRYYLMCAVPGTQYATYCDNCYIADSPLGPFRFCENSPVVWKSTGFVQGAGHGCLTRDAKGRWWRVETCRLTGFNRRLAMFPAMFDEAGDTYTNTMLGDWPMYVPMASKAPFERPGPAWGLLSRGRRATASSNAYGAKCAFDEDMTTAWVPASDAPGEWLAVDLGKVCAVRSVQVNFRDLEAQSGGRENDWAYRYTLEFSRDGREWRTFADRSHAKTLRHHEYIELEKPVGARYMRLTNKSGEIPGGALLAVSGLRVFGDGGVAAPAPVDCSLVKVERAKDDNRKARVAWPAAAGAEGYIVRHGIAPDKLYTQDQVFGETEYTVRALNRGVDYWFAVDAFNAGGVAPAAGRPAPVPATEARVEGCDMCGDSPSPAIEGRLAGVETHEAEAAEHAGAGVRGEYDVRASGAAALWGLGPKGTRAVFKGVRAPSAGAAKLRVSYSAPFPARVRISIDGKNPRETTLKATGGWPTYRTVDVPLDGARPGGENTVAIEGCGDGFHLDFIQLHGE